MKILTPIILILCISQAGLAHRIAPKECGIQGIVIELDTGDPLPDAHLLLYQKGVFIAGTVSDQNGFYQIQVAPGKYDMEISYIGFPSQTYRRVIVKARKFTRLNLEMEGLSTGIELSQIEVRDFKVPLIYQDHTSSTGIISGSNINNVKEEEQEGDIYLRGSRADLLLGGTPAAFPNAEEMSITPIDSPVSDPISNQEEYQVIVENDFVSPWKETFSTFSIDVDHAAYSIIRRDIQRGVAPAPDVARTEEMVNYFDYQYPQPQGPNPFAVYTEVNECPWNRDHQLLHIGLQGKTMDWQNAPANNLVFLIDVSGSMSAPNKLPLLISSFGLLVKQVRPEDRVSIVVYAGAAGLVLPPTSGTDRHKILAALDKLAAGGSTAGAKGIHLAYQTAQEQFIPGGNNRVILATDGDFNIGVSSSEGLEKLITQKRDAQIFLTVLGFGYSNLKDNRLETLADKGNGNYAFIDDLKEAKKVFIREITGTLVTIAKDVKVQVIFDPRQVDSYRLIGYENRRLRPEDFADDKIDAGELGAGHTVTALYEIIPRQTILQQRKNNRLNICPVDGIPAMGKSRAMPSKPLATLNLRYKAPEANQSKLLQEFIHFPTLAGKATDHFNFSAAVAGFSLLLRDSKYRGKVDLALLAELAQAGLGSDPYGDRAAFIQMMKTYEHFTLTSSK